MSLSRRRRSYREGHLCYRQRACQQQKTLASWKKLQAEKPRENWNSAKKRLQAEYHGL